MVVDQFDHVQVLVGQLVVVVWQIVIQCGWLLVAISVCCWLDDRQYQVFV